MLLSRESLNQGRLGGFDTWIPSDNINSASTRRKAKQLAIVNVCLACLENLRSVYGRKNNKWSGLPDERD